MSGHLVLRCEPEAKKLFRMTLEAERNGRAPDNLSAILSLALKTVVLKNEDTDLGRTIGDPRAMTVEFPDVVVDQDGVVEFNGDEVKKIYIRRDN